jgi:predicted  nucleic acid-binding Zn-ribbon protein
MSVDAPEGLLIPIQYIAVPVVVALLALLGQLHSLWATRRSRAAEADRTEAEITRTVAETADISLEFFRETIVALRQECTEMGRRLNETQARMAVVVAERDAELLKLSRRVEDLEERLAAERARHQELEDIVKNRDEAIRKLEARIAGLEKELALERQLRQTLEQQLARYQEGEGARQQRRNRVD